MTDIFEAFRDFRRQVIRREQAAPYVRPDRPHIPPPPGESAAAPVEKPPMDPFYGSLDLTLGPDVDREHGDEIRRRVEAYDGVVGAFVKLDRVKQHPDGTYEIDGLQTDEDNLLNQVRVEVGDMVAPHVPGQPLNKALREQVQSLFTPTAAVHRLTAKYSQEGSPA